MLSWIGNNLGTILITLVLIAVVAAIIRSLHNNHCAGKTATAPTAPWRAPATVPTARKSDP